MAGLTDFLEWAGSPKDAQAVSVGSVEAGRGRLPDDMLELWLTHGTGGYADGKYWTCLPELFDSFLESTLSTHPTLNGGDLAAFGYSCLGAVDLWHVEERHFVYDLQSSLLMDNTSLKQTSQLPYNIEELAELAGVSRQEAEEGFRKSQSQPEDIWLILMAATDEENYKRVYSDDGSQLIERLEQDLGSLSNGQVFFPQSDAQKDGTSAYRKQALRELLMVIPSSITHTRYRRVGATQESFNEEISVRPAN